MEFIPIVFKIGNEEYGVDINVVRGIEKSLSSTSKAGKVDNIKGIVELRGKNVPLYSLRRKFLLPETDYTEDSKTIIVGIEDILLAIEVDSVEEIQNTDAKDIFEVPKIIQTDKNKYYDKIISINRRLIMLIDMGKLLSEEEKAYIREVVPDKQ